MSGSSTWTSPPAASPIPSLDSPGLTYHHASMQIVEDGPKRCRFVWTTDFLPDEAASGIRPVIEAGTKALKTNLETGNGSAAASA